MKFIRINIFLLSICFLFGFLAYAETPETLIKQANNLYQKQNYKGAEKIYQALVDSGYSGVSLFYNLGNTYYREGNLGFAILNYERALRLSPGDEDIQHNLALANSKTVDKIETLPEFFLFQWWEGLVSLFSLQGWTYTAYIFYFLLLISIGIYFFARKTNYQKYSLFSGLILFILLIFTVILLVVNLNRQKIKNGIVIEQTAIVKVSPDTKSSDAFVIHEGLKVKLEDKIDNWVKIKLNDGKVGWLQKQKLEVI